MIILLPVEKTARFYYETGLRASDFEHVKRIVNSLRALYSSQDYINSVLSYMDDLETGFEQ